MPRKPGSQRSDLADNERKLIVALRDACEKFGENNPIVQEMLALEVYVARGAPRYRGRHIGDRLRAARDILDRMTGKPPQTIRVTKADDEDLLGYEKWLRSNKPPASS